MRLRSNSSYKGCSVNPALLSLACLSFVVLPVIVWTVTMVLEIESTHEHALRFIPDNFKQRGSGQQKQQPQRPMQPSAVQRMKCEDLFNGTSVEQFTHTDLYKAHVKDFDQILKREHHLNASTYDQLHESPQLYRALQYITVSTRARRACIAGFNLGQAALYLLTANRKIVVYAFRRSTALPLSYKIEAEFKRRFKDRLHVYNGDTVQSIPHFIATNQHKARCDIMLVNGPIDYHIAKADVTNLARLARPVKNFIIFVNPQAGTVEQMGGVNFGGEAGGKWRDTGGSTGSWNRAIKAWEESCSSGMIVEKVHCDFTSSQPNSSHNPYRGFAVGIVQRDPNTMDGVKDDRGRNATIASTLNSVEIGRRIGPLAETSIKSLAATRKHYSEATSRPTRNFTNRRLSFSNSTRSRFRDRSDKFNQKYSNGLYSNSTQSFNGYKRREKLNYQQVIKSTTRPRKFKNRTQSVRNGDGVLSSAGNRTRRQKTTRMPLQGIKN